jgi:hypothetical protein
MILWCGLAALALVVTAATALLPVRIEPEAIVVPQSFADAVGAYGQLRLQIEQALPPFQRFSDPRAIEASISARRAAVRAARPGARAGDVFNADTRVAFRALIQNMLSERGYTTDDLIENEPDEGPAEEPSLVVYGPFHWAFGNLMAPSLLDALPQLPAPLQYRLAGRDLVLVDVDANLVIDILRDALPAASPHKTE